MLSADDPPLFLSNTEQPSTNPFADPETVDMNLLLHHPLHIATLQTAANQAGITTIAYAPSIAIVDPSAEQPLSFILRHLR
jgi:hypothetical protein